MNIVRGYPPNIDQLDEAFGVRAIRGVIVTWGGSVFIPNGGVLTPSLAVHERVHSERQTTDVKNIEAWWSRYIADAEFRLAEEIPAHRAEFREFCRLHLDRNAQSKHCTAIARRLSSALYGGLINFKDAKAHVEGAR